MEQCDKVCGTCEYHEDFSNACFNGKSNKCTEVTQFTDSCTVWRKRTRPVSKEYKEFLKRQEKTEQIIANSVEGKTCRSCQLFERDPSTKAGGYCPIPKKRGITPLDPPKKYRTAGMKACRQYLERTDEQG